MSKIGGGFYRRNPGDALAGMVGMTLEERGVYNTVIDLLYLTWRPLEDSRAYIAGHCGCAVQKLNPIINSLIARGKLLRFEEGGCFYLSNPRFEAERKDVKGTSQTRSGRTEVGEKSGEVGEKSAGVSQTPPLCEENGEENLFDTSLDRLDQIREENPPVAPQGASRKKSATPIRKDFPDERAILEARERIRLERADVQVSYQSERFRNWALGKDARYADWPATWRNWIVRACRDAPKLPEPIVGSLVLSEDPWRRRCQIFMLNGSWHEDWGTRPGRDGCEVPPDLLTEFGIAGGHPDMLRRKALHQTTPH